MTESFDGTLFGEHQPCFGCGTTHPFGFHLTFAREGDEVVSRFTPGDTFQGPPGILHGGLVATLADEVAAWTVVLALGKFGFTAAFEGKLLRPIRIGREVDARGRILKSTSRTIEVEVVASQNDVACFRGLFRFVLVDEKAAERVLEGPIPDEWKRLCR